MISELQKRKLFQVLDLLAEIGRVQLADHASQVQKKGESVAEADRDVIASTEVILMAEE